MRHVRRALTSPCGPRLAGGSGASWADLRRGRTSGARSRPDRVSEEVPY